MLVRVMDELYLWPSPPVIWFNYIGHLLRNYRVRVSVLRPILTRTSVTSGRRYSPPSSKPLERRKHRFTCLGTGQADVRMGLTWISCRCSWPPRRTRPEGDEGLSGCSGRRLYCGREHLLSATWLAATPWTSSTNLASGWKRIKLMAIQLHALTSLYFNGLNDTIGNLAVRPRNGRAKEDRKESQRKVKVKGKSRSTV